MIFTPEEIKAVKLRAYLWYMALRALTFEMHEMIMALERYDKKILLLDIQTIDKQKISWWSKRAQKKPFVQKRNNIHKIIHGRFQGIELEIFSIQQFMKKCDYTEPRPSDAKIKNIRKLEYQAGKMFNEYRKTANAFEQRAYTLLDKGDAERLRKSIIHTRGMETIWLKRAMGIESQNRTIPHNRKSYARMFG